MKTNTKLVLLALAIIISACQTKQEECQKVILSGKIENPNSGKILFYLETFPEFTWLDTAYLNNEGVFFVAFAIDSCMPVVFHDSLEISHMYICPCDSLFITLNTKQFDESLYYDGVGATKNNIMVDYFHKFKDPHREGYIDLVKVKDTSIADFYELATQYREEITGYADSVSSNIELEEAFTRYLNTDANFTSLNLLSEPWSRWVNRTDTTKQAKDIIDTLRKMVISAATFENPDWSNLELMRYYNHSLVYCFLYDLLIEYRPIKTERVDSALHDQYIVAAPRMYEEYLKNEVARYRQSYDTNSLLSIMRVIEKYAKNESFKQETIQEYEERLNALRQNLPADAVLIDLYDEQFTNMEMNDILDEYNGNVIYLDFWSSGCKPCISEFPYSNALHEKLSGEGVVFLYMSLDFQFDPWKEALIFHQQGGIHYRLNNYLQQEVRELYGLWTIPHYVLYDRDGNLVEKKMTRPSDPETEKRIRELLSIEL